MPAVAKQESLVLVLQFFDYEGTIVSSEDLKDFLNICIVDSKEKSCADAFDMVTYVDKILSVTATFVEAGSYKIMVFMLETPVSKDGYEITVQAEKKAEQKQKENNKETGEDQLYGFISICQNANVND